MANTSYPLTISDPGQEGLGPAFLNLNERQRKFVMALFEIGVDTNHTRAAEMAGYTGTPGTLKVQAHKLFHNPKIQQALHDMSMSQLLGSKMMLTSQLIHLAANASKDSDKLKATLAAMDRIGLHAISEHHVKTENISETKEALIAQLKSFLIKNPDFPIPDKYKKYLEPPTKVIDGEFNEIAEDPDAALGL